MHAFIIMAELIDIHCRPRQLEVKALQALEAQMQSRRPRQDVAQAEYAQYDVDRSQIAAQYRLTCVNCVCNVSPFDIVCLVAQLRCCIRWLFESCHLICGHCMCMCLVQFRDVCEGSGLCGCRATQIALVDANMWWLTSCLAAASSDNPSAWCEAIKQCPRAMRAGVTNIVARYVSSLAVYNQ